MIPFGAPVEVIRWGERRGGADGPRVLVVTVNRWDAGIVARGLDGWTACTRPRGLFPQHRRHAKTVCSTPYAAVAAIITSPFSCRRGAGALSRISWSDAAAAAAQDEWGEWLPGVVIVP